MNNAIPIACMSFCLGIVVAAPARSATLTESQFSGLITGEVLCSLARQGAPEEIIREEYARLTKKAINADTLELSAHGEAYLSVIAQVMQVCPERDHPDT